jgi:hypothetical protein
MLSLFFTSNITQVFHAIFIKTCDHFSSKNSAFIFSLVIIYNNHYQVRKNCSRKENRILSVLLGSSDRNILKLANKVNVFMSFSDTSIVLWLWLMLRFPQLPLLQVHQMYMSVFLIPSLFIISISLREYFHSLFHRLKEYLGVYRHSYNSGLVTFSQRKQLIYSILKRYRSLLLYLCLIKEAKPFQLQQVKVNQA